MEWLLKIVEGPMRGAEIALVEGLRVRVGSGEDCDIVLADAALPAEAFSLDVKSDAVSLVRGEDVKMLVPFEVFEVGSSAFAIGPAEGVWEPLKKPENAETKADATSGALRGDSTDVAETSEATAAEKREATGEATSLSPRGNGNSASSDASASSHSRRGLLACCCALVVLLVVAAAAWFFWPQIARVCPQAESSRVAFAGWFRGVCGVRTQIAPPGAPTPSLADLARQYNLTLTNYPRFSIRHPLSTVRHPLLRGNFARRTERMAVRALAFAADPTVKLELTDDESLAAAVDEILFVVTEDEITSTSATNGVVTLAGFAPDAVSFERTLRALNADVPGIKKVLASAVQVGGLAPPKRVRPKKSVAEAPHPDCEAPLAPTEAPPALTETTQSFARDPKPVAGTPRIPTEPPQIPTGTTRNPTEPAQTRVGGSQSPTGTPKAFDVTPQPAVVKSIWKEPFGRPVSSRNATKKKPQANPYPIAGILTTPYRTVVLENGMRVTEGGRINQAVVWRIEPDRIVFRSGATTFEWKP